MSDLVTSVVDRHLSQGGINPRVGMKKQAGEVRFIKDRGGDKNEWGWGSPGPIEREIQEEFEYNPKNMKPLAETLRAALLAMGHALSAHATFNRIKSAQVSPDGALGGKGYIQKISDMRRQLMNVCEALSAVTDTLYDEIRAPHWSSVKQMQGPRERDEVKNIMNDVNEIRTDPEGFAENQEAGMDDDNEGRSPEKSARQKKASLNSMCVRVADRHLVGRGVRREW